MKIYLLHLRTSGLAYQLLNKVPHVHASIASLSLLLYFHWSLWLLSFVIICLLFFFKRTKVNHQGSRLPKSKHNLQGLWLFFVLSSKIFYLSILTNSVSRTLRWLFGNRTINECTQDGRDRHKHHQSLIQSLMYMKDFNYIIHHGSHKTHVAIKTFNQNQKLFKNPITHTPRAQWFLTTKHYNTETLFSSSSPLKVVLVHSDSMSGTIFISNYRENSNMAFCLQ